MNSLPPSPEGQAELASLEAKVNALLPPQYQFGIDGVRPTSMGSAGIRYGPDSRVAWNEIWTSFCDLALAGGPPHRGSFLEVPTSEEVEAEPAPYPMVVAELQRGIRMTTGLEAAALPEKGWLAVRCHDEWMAGWLLRAITAENVFTRQRHEALLLPVGPDFRLAKEIKNVVVALAKTCHYWCDHLSPTQKSAIAAILACGEPPLLEPASRPEILARGEDYRGVVAGLRLALKESTGLPVVASRAVGWVGVQLPDVMTAAWFVRAAVAENILARREEEILYVPVPGTEGTGQQVDSFDVAERLARLRRFWVLRCNSQ